MISETHSIHRKPDGTLPSPDEAEHFYYCWECGQAVDMRELRELLHHGPAGHPPLDMQ